MSWNTLQEIYGQKLLRYIYGLADDGSGDGEEILNAHADVTSTLLILARGIPQGDANGTGKYMSLSGLGRWIETESYSLVNYLRISTGNELPPMPNNSDDAVLDALIVVARDIWATFLIPPSSTMPTFYWTSNLVGLFQNPHAINFLKLALKDTALQKLYPQASPIDIDNLTDTEAINVQAYWISGSGSGGTQQLTSLPSYILNDACARVILSRNEITWERVVLELKHSLKIMRDLANGKTVRVPRLMAFSGLKITGSDTRVIGDVTLRAPDVEYDTYFIPEVEKATLICETTYPIKLIEITGWSVGSPLPPLSRSDILQKTHQETQKQINLVRLALLLASRGDQFLATLERNSFILDPTRPGGALYSRLVYMPLPYIELDDELAQSAGVWYRTLKEKHVNSLDIGMRRLLQAVSERLDAVDAFVDAVIAWENVFGTNQETVFRVTGALAKILESSDIEKRTELHKELKDLYGKRSKLVHGSREPSTTQIYEIRNRAISIAIMMLKNLYADRPDLLPLKSEERSAKLLLE